MASGRGNLLPTTAVRRFTTYKHVIDIKLTIIQSVKIYIVRRFFFFFFFFFYFILFIFLYFIILEKKDRTVIKV